MLMFWKLKKSTVGKKTRFGDLFSDIGEREGSVFWGGWETAG